jgi:MFS family permease
MVIDNVNEIAEAVNKYPSSFFVALIALANGAGRVTAGLASDKITSFSHLELLSAAAAAMGVAQSAFAVGSETLLYPSLLAVGYLFGCTVSLMAVNIADIFGSKYVATNFGAVDSAPIFGSYLFVTAIVAIFYKTNYVDDEGNEICLGASCFRIPFIINACCCFGVALLIAYMHIKTPLDDVNTGGGH